MRNIRQTTEIYSTTLTHTLCLLCSRIYSCIPLIDNEQLSSLSTGEKLKLKTSLTNVRYSKIIAVSLRYKTSIEKKKWRFFSSYNRCRVNVLKTKEKIRSHFNGFVAYLEIWKIKMTVFCFLLFSDTKETMFCVLQSRPKLGYTY
jgi:hypothetical protein